MPNATLNAAITRLCHPQTGVTTVDVFRRAEAAQDRRASDTMHGHVPRWDELSTTDQENLALQEAEQWLRDFETATPSDPRPVDHYSASSPPWPSGAAELRHWDTWCRNRVDELTWMADAQGPEAFVRGRLNEGRRWARHLRARGNGTPAVERTGVDELAYWIVWLETRALDLDTGGLDTELAKGEQAEAKEFVWRIRSRQAHRGSPMFWRHGGRGLLAALGLLVDDHAALTDDVVVVAAHDVDDQPQSLGGQQRDVVSVLRAWTAQDPPACEQAIRNAHARELVDGRTPREVTTTLRGERAYRGLLDSIR
ncbi:hypothetical protein [Amycolatopsis sp. cmx-4-61]|uniref:hypothetical protein n=1 Tax=Amycolatopsis sp. cmx-4-61 TaxID=2790937 RepID=UPI00397B5A8B